REPEAGGRDHLASTESRVLPELGTYLRADVTSPRAHERSRSGTERPRESRRARPEQQPDEADAQTAEGRRVGWSARGQGGGQGRTTFTLVPRCSAPPPSVRRLSAFHRTRACRSRD